LWMLPFMSDWTNVVESFGNSSGVQNVEAIEAFLTREYPIDSYAENRTLMQNVLHSLAGTQETTDSRDHMDRVLDSMGLTWWAEEE